MRSVHRRYLREFLPAMGGYVALVVLYGALAPRLRSLPLRVVLALLPMLPIVLAFRAIVRVIRDQDELERRIDLQAIAVAAMLVGGGFFTLGLLLSAGMWPGMAARDVAFWVMPCLFGSFGIVKLLLRLRYRET